MSKPPPLNPVPQEDDDSYQRFADTIGGVPSLKRKDNLMQGIVVLLFTGIGAFLGWLLPSEVDKTNLILGGAFGGMILGTFISGLILMIFGLTRASNRKRKRQQP
ncbi:MAG: hypothetical protein OSA93_15475 [Akkermansiaceae bacterium]|jgi:hypothetical protein|nr:hypothetical protein [Akkermansiaceae bacterium]